METVNIQINGMPLSVPKGISILEAARYAGIEIPTLCYLKDINEIGACRMCLVEVKGAKGLVTACVYPVNEGMEVFTNTPKVLNARKLTLELVLSTHEKKCLSCIRSTDCELQALCREYGVRNIEKADGGYGKGYTHALTHWRKVVNLLQELRDKRGMMVILVAHAKVERFEDPENAAYDRYTPRLHKHAASLIAEWVDAVLFANKKFRVTKDSGDRAIAAPIGADGGERIIRTVGSPACIAKNRYGLPGEIPLSWTAFINAYQKTMEKNHGQVQ